MVNTFWRVLSGNVDKKNILKKGRKCFRKATAGLRKYRTCGYSRTGFIGIIISHFLLASFFCFGILILKVYRVANGDFDNMIPVNPGCIGSIETK